MALDVDGAGAFIEFRLAEIGRGAVQREAQLGAASRLGEFDQHVSHLAGPVAEFLHCGVRSAHNHRLLDGQSLGQFIHG
jgi:hypothetical protein